MDRHWFIKIGKIDIWKNQYLSHGEGIIVILIFQTVENLFCFQGFNLQKQGSINLYTPTQVFSCKYCEILNNSFFIEHFWWLLLNLVRRSEDIVEVFKIFYVWLINVLLICVYFSHFLLCIPLTYYSAVLFSSFPL